MKKMVFAAVSMVVTAVFAEPVTVSTVDELVSELSACDGETPKTIILAEGDYQLTSAHQTTNGTYGISHLAIPKKVTLKGAGDSPEDVRIIGDGETGRIMYLSSNSIVLDNLTLTNGVTVDAETVTNGKEEFRGAGLVGYGVITNCIIIGNHASGIGGAVASSSRTTGMTMYNSLIINNSGTTCGGVYNARCWDCTIAGNTARTGEGGGAYSCTLVGGIVSNNVVEASKDGGGLYGCSATGTTITYNSAASQKGGGAASGAYTNCAFIGNYAKYGGGVSRARLYKCNIYNNMSTSHGGGLYGCIADNCTIWNNFAKGEGGGHCDGTNYFSVVSNNFSAGAGPNSYGTDLFDCQIIGMSVGDGSATRCVFRDIGYEQSLIGNPHYSTNQQSIYAYNYYPNATNCLFIGNKLNGASSSLFCGVQGANKASSIVNCTVVSNTYNYLARYFRDQKYPILIQNTVFYDNFKYGGTPARDVHIVTDPENANRCAAGALIFDHCAYKTKTSTLDLAEYILDDSLYCFGEDGFGADPKFVLAKDAVHPYSLRLSSPLIGRGRVCDWMTGAYDIRGEEDDGKYLRVRDGKVDIGCYQCWLNPVGMTVVVR